MARRAELITIGRKLFADTSYDALSMDDIAKQAGVAKGLIYYYFKSKRGYYLAIIEDSVAELVARAGGTTTCRPWNGCSAPSTAICATPSTIRRPTAPSSAAASASTPRCRPYGTACARR